MIGIFHDLKIMLPQDAPEVPHNGLIPREWAVFAKFDLDAEEEGKKYSLSVDIVWPDGILLNRSIIHAPQPKEGGIAFIARMQGFPMGQDGLVKVIQTLMIDETVVFGPFELGIRVRVEKSLPPTGIAI